MAKAFLFLILFLPGAVEAQEQPGVVINEIAWMGTSVQGVEEKQWWRYEWLELYNNVDTVGMLDGWIVRLYRGNELYFEIPIGGTVPPQGYFLIGASDKIQGVDVNYANLGGKFLNTGQKIVLSNAVGAVVDEVDATTGWFGGDNKTKHTMERVGVSDTPTWQTSTLAGGTPKAPNSIGFKILEKSTKYFGDSNNISRNSAVQETEKDLPAVATALQAGLLGSSSLDSKLSFTKDTQELQSFQSRVPIVNPITLLAGFLALGFSGVLLVVKRLLASRQERRRT
ncbi:MAG: lamin tail domain-containing protein [Candidatus Wildermuthbacteria bacterium]|nr:lamin tail domain-containing protein [Candidatus Wildermuthbacteria bacterium]